MIYDYTIEDGAILYKGMAYSFIIPEDFEAWLKTKQDAFIQGYLHAYAGALQEQVNVTPWSQQEILI